MKLRWILVLALLLMALPMANVGAQSKLRVVATTTQAADLARILAGDRIELTALMGAGVDPHLYKPTESDIRAMNEAQLVIYNGLDLEGQFETVFEALGQRNVRTYALSTPVEAAGFVLEAQPILGKPAGAPDPHFWFDPRNWQLATEGLAKVLGEEDPANAEFYAANAKEYLAQLEKLFNWAQSAMTDAAIPEDKRILVTSHDAFQYFGETIGWRVSAIQGISTQAEASVADIQAVADIVVKEGIHVIFVETSVPRNTIEAVVAAVKAKGGDVRIGVRDLYSDAMDAPNTFGGTYTGMIAHNVITILQSFGYSVPALPEDVTPPLPAELLATN